MSWQSSTRCVLVQVGKRCSVGPSPNPSHLMAQYKFFIWKYSVLGNFSILLFESLHKSWKSSKISFKTELETPFLGLLQLICALLALFLKPQAIWDIMFQHEPKLEMEVTRHFPSKWWLLEKFHCHNILPVNVVFPFLGPIPLSVSKVW